MTSAVTLQDAPRPKSVLIDMATRFGMEPGAFEATLRATVVPDKSTKEQFAAFLLVAKEYHLNPLTKEIYAFPSRAGGIQPIVSIDGWMNLVNSHPASDGMEFEDVFDDAGKLKAITCRMYRKDRSHPTSVTEYMSECVRNTDTWKQWPARMLRHKAAIQCARYAFGFSGIMDEDEYERMQSARDAGTSFALDRPKATVIQSTGNGSRKELPPMVGHTGDVAPRDPDLKAAFNMQAPSKSEVVDADTGEISDGLETDALIVNYGGWVADMETRLKAASEAEKNTIWNDEIAPRQDALSPPDAARLRMLADQP